MNRLLLSLGCVSVALFATATERAVVFSENFDLLVDGSNDSPAVTELSANGKIEPSLMHGYQWNGRGLHSAGGALAVLHFEESDWFGTTELQGYIETPYTDVRLDGGLFTVKFKAKSVPADGATLHVEAYDPYTTNAIDTSVITITDEWQTYEVSLTHPGYGNHLAYLQIASEANDWLIDDFEIVQNYEGLMPPIAHFAKNVSYEQFTAYWNPVPFATGYLLSAFSVDDMGNRDYIVKDRAVDGCELTVTGTVKGTEYFYTVQSVNDQYKSASTEPIKVHVPLNTLETPKVLTASEVSDNGFTARWEPVFRAMGYIVNLKRSHVAVEDEVFSILHEDFSKCENQYDYVQPFYGKSDDITVMPGWLFPDFWSRYDDGMLGYSNYYHNYEDINIQSPSLDLSNAGGVFTVKANVVGEKGCTVKITCGAQEKSYKLQNAADSFSLVFDNGSDDTVLTFRYDGSGDILYDDIEICQTIKAGETVAEQVGTFNTNEVSSAPVTEYVFDNLDVKQGDSFIYTVKAWSWSLGEDGVWGPTVYSESSEPMLVSMGNSGIDDIDSGKLIVKANGHDIYVQTPEQCRVMIYDATGRLCGSYSVPQGATELHSPVSGFSIVKVGSATFKLLVK